MIKNRPTRFQAGLNRRLLSTAPQERHEILIEEGVLRGHDVFLELNPDVIDIPHLSRVADATVHGSAAYRSVRRDEVDVDREVFTVSYRLVGINPDS